MENPSASTRVLLDFVSAAKEALGETLLSVVLYGSGAEDALRPSSDLNVILVLARFEPARVAALRGPLAAAAAAARLNAMFLLESEVQAAAEAFAEKFDDIGRRRRVLFGSDPFAGLSVPRAALVTRLNQSLLNLTLRLRESFATRGGSEDQVERLVAEAAGPLRSSAGALLALEGRSAPSPKEALKRLAATLPGEGWEGTLERVSAAREHRTLPPGAAEETFFRLLELAAFLRQRARSL